MEYTVFFEICGKKMKKTYNASSKEEVKEMLRREIKIHKIESEDDLAMKELKETINQFGNIFK